MSGFTWSNITPAWDVGSEWWEFVGELRNGVMPARIRLSLRDGVWRVACDGLDAVMEFGISHGVTLDEVRDFALDVIAERLDSAHVSVSEALEQARKVAP